MKVLMLLKELNKNLIKKIFHNRVLEIFKLLTIDRTYLPNFLFTFLELRRFEFSRSGLSLRYNTARKKFLLANVILIKFWIGKVLTSPSEFFPEAQLTGNNRL